MKQIYLFILLVITAGSTFAQGAYTISTKLVAVADMVTPTNTDVTEDTVEFFNADEYTTIFAPLLVINSGTGSDSVKVKRTVLSVVPGTTNFFCWDLCYSAGTSQSIGTVTIAATDTVTVFSADYNPAGNVGTSYINYKFYNDDDTTEFANVIVKFTSGIVGIEEQQAAISNAYPNPASSQITFDYVVGQNEGNIIITDLTGKVVRTSILPANSTKHVVDLNGLTEGIYIYSFYSKNKAIATKKFLINK